MSKHVSPSQISTFARCERKWAYSRVRPRTQNKYAAFGTRCHSIAEDWLRDGTPPPLATPEGRTIAAGLEYIPPPRTAAVEHKFDMHVDGVHYTGMIDFLFGYEPGKTIVIGDHKTTGDFKNAKSVAELQGDPQWIIYANWALSATTVERVIGVWVYYLRATGRITPAARPVCISESREVLQERMRGIHSTALRIVERQGRPIEDSPRNLTACRDYGGCPYAGECLHGLSDSDKLAGSLEGLI